MSVKDTAGESVVFFDIIVLKDAIAVKSKSIFFCVKGGGVID